jgi:hypothetical protein
MATNRNDDNWRKQNYKSAGDRWAESSDEKSVLTPKRDYGFKDDHDISTKFGGEFLRATNPWDESSWKPGPVSRGGEPRHSPKGYHTTHQRGPQNMTNSAGSAVKPGDSKFYKKMPGRAGNQRSGD